MSIGNGGRMVDAVVGVVDVGVVDVGTGDVVEGDAVVATGTVVADSADGGAGPGAGTSL